SWGFAKDEVGIASVARGVERTISVRRSIAGSTKSLAPELMFMSSGVDGAAYMLGRLGDLDDEYRHISSNTGSVPSHESIYTERVVVECCQPSNVRPFTAFSPYGISSRRSGRSGPVVVHYVGFTDRLRPS